MNKMFIKVAFVTVAAQVSGFKFFDNQNLSSLSEIALANMETLASNEQIDMRRGYKLIPKSSTCSVCEWTGVDNDYCNVSEQLPDCYGGKE